jgi:site-specific DNA-adenine methylase
MKTHFIFPYVGNKREEVEKIYEILSKHIDFNSIDTIVEPYCGSSALSYYISTLHPKKFNYVLNDNDKNLIDLYKILSDDVKVKNFISNVNDLCFDKQNNFITKQQYLNLTSSNDDVYAYFIKHKYHKMRPGLYPPGNVKPVDISKFLDIPIMNFLRTEKISFQNIDAIDAIKFYNQKNNLILCDPPYLSANNDFYFNGNVNIYEWLHENHSSLYNTAFILENNWIIKLLFKDVKNKETYKKNYRCFNKRKVDHVVALYN